MPKLPADLPENWTRGQTISPNGTEVGLTEQHGYNYLMKQVNNTQTEVNNINDALPDVAQQVTVEEINNKIGTESDADTQPTLFGRLAQLKNVLLEKLAELLTKVTGIDTKIGTSSDSSNTDTLFGKIQAVKESTAAKRYFFSETVQETKQGYDFISIKNANKAMSVILFSKVAEYDGTIGFSTTLNINARNGSDYIAIAAFTPSTIIGSGSGNETNLEQVFFSPERTVYGPQAYGTIIPYIGPGVDSTYKGLVNFKYVGSTVGGPSIDTTVLVNCKKGEKIVVLGMAYGTGVSDTFNIGQIDVKYDIK